MLHAERDELSGCRQLIHAVAALDLPLFLCFFHFSSLLGARLAGPRTHTYGFMQPLDPYAITGSAKN